VEWIDKFADVGETSKLELDRVIDLAVLQFLYTVDIFKSRWGKHLLAEFFVILNTSELLHICFSLNQNTLSF